MAVHERQNSVVHRTRLKQRGSRVKPKVATVSLARGVFGGDRRTNTETEQEQSNAGEFRKTLTPSASIHRYHACPWTQTYNSLYLSLNTSSLRPFLPVLERIFIYDQLLQISFSLYNARSFKYFFFLFTNFNYLHRNLTLIIINNSSETLNSAPGAHHRLPIRRWSFTSVWDFCDNSKPRFAFQQWNSGWCCYRCWKKKKHLTHIARREKAIGGVYFTKKWRAETLQPALKFDNFKPQFNCGIVKKYPGWTGWFLGVMIAVFFKEGVKAYLMAPMSPLNSPTFLL